MAKGFQTLHLCFAEIVRDDLTKNAPGRDFLPVLLFVGYKLSDLASGFTPEAAEHDREFFRDVATNAFLLEIDGPLTPEQEERIGNDLAASWRSESGRKEFWFPNADELAEVSLALHHGLLPQALMIAVSAFEGYLKDVTAAAVLANQEIRQRFYDEVIRGGGKDLAIKVIEEGPRAYATFVSDQLGTPNSEAVHKHFQKLLATRDRFGSPSDDRALDTLLEYRHLIAHRAGIVDSDFKQRVKSQDLIGQAVRMDRDLVSGGVAVIERISARIQAELTRAITVQRGSSSP